MPHETATTAPLEPLTVDDGSTAVGEFLSSVNNYERLWAAENSVPGYSAPAKTKSRRRTRPSYNQKVARAVGGEISQMT